MSLDFNRVNVSVKYFCLCSFLVCSAVSTVDADTKTPGTEAGSFPKPDDLSADLQPVLENHGLPALAVAVMREGKLAGVGVVGVRKYGAPDPVSIRDRFHLGSCTKPFTATLIGILVDEEKLSWDTPLAEALPFLKRQMHKDYQSVTLAMLLSHRSGLPENFPSEKTFRDLHALKGSPTRQRHEYTRMLLSESPAYTPGTQYQYSNAGFAIAGYIAEKTARTSYEALIRNKIFKPLKMKTAGFGAMGSPGKIKQPWQHAYKDKLLTPIEPGPRSDNPVVLTPATRIHCSIQDWARFASVHFTGEGYHSDFLKPETLRKLHDPGNSRDYTLGWGFSRRLWGENYVLSHLGSNGWNYAGVWIAPESGFAILIATNQGGQPAADACDEVRDLLLKKYLNR